MHHLKTKLIFMVLSIVFHAASVFAAEKVDVSQKEMKFLQQYLGQQPSFKQSWDSALREKKAGSVHQDSLKEKNRDQDFNNTVHIRAKQMFAGYPVWGGDIIIHVPDGKSITLTNAARVANASMNGVLYQQLQEDLQHTPAYIFKPEQAQLALSNAIYSYEHKHGLGQSIEYKKSELIVYVDAQHKAHFAFHVSFYIGAQGGLPAHPHYIMDASSFLIYKEWNEIKTFANVKGGGYGGNLRAGKLIYDGLSGHLPALTIKRDPTEKICYLQNDTIVVKTYSPDQIARFKCDMTDKTHNNVYWDELGDEVNGGYSPNHDALFTAMMTEAMYQSWYKLPVLAKDGSPTAITMITHSPNFEGSDVPNHDTAYYDDIKQAAVFGDGLVEFYPLASIDVGAHELSHGFTDQHAGLILDGQAGGLNESFSDMAAKAVEYFTFGTNRWDLGSTVKKTPGKALRYMDQPSKDCEGKSNDVFGCSIDDMGSYYPFLDLHQISGIFNRVFYLIANSKGWDTKKAFDIMLTEKVMKELKALKHRKINLSDEEAPEIKTWGKAVVGKFYRPVKKKITVRIDADVLEWFRHSAKKYQTLINLACREYMINHERPRKKIRHKHI